VVAGVVGALSLARAPAQPPLTKVVFLTNYVFQGRHAPFFVGVEKGFYRNAGIDLSVSPASGSAFVIAAVESGKADYGMAETAPLVQAIGHGAQVKAFAVFMDVTTSGLASLAPFPAPDRIVDRTVAASLTDSARVILPIIFTRARLDPGRIKWLTADPSVYASLLLAGRTDLVTASSDGDMPALQRVASPRGKAVYFSSFASWGYDVFGYLLLARAERLAANANAARAFAAATAQAVGYALDHPEETARTMVRHNPMLDYDTVLAQWRASRQAIDTPFVKAHGYGVATPDRVERSIAMVKQAFRIDAPLTAKDVYADVK
jgi:NitT/TauT family transport system substrate-binding protein